ncbi:hypothetical protein [uncultured Sphingomonas sp.]|uniref:hypothetical protein n=1 Tax=uncultured Sphingomonas sp. TaxID=158754 RepID=UPI0035C9C01D
MFNPKPLASLSSQLLARKGQAKPAMRSQGYGGFSSGAAGIEDLGWNDMGHEPAPEPTPIGGAGGPMTGLVPPVLALREALTEKIEAVEVVEAVTSKQSAEPTARPAEPRPISIATATRIGRDSAKQTARSKAAFTLRLDAPRHLQLRLASALANRSAQAIVAEALDRLIADTPEVDALIAQLPAPKTRK